MLEDLFKIVKTRLNDDDVKVDNKVDIEIPEGLLFKCPRCSYVLFVEEFDKYNRVCPECNYHSRLTAKERLDITIDKGSLIEYDKNMTSKNPL